MRLRLLFFTLPWLWSVYAFPGTPPVSGDETSACVARSFSSKKRESKLITLFEGDKPVANFNKVVKTIRPGDRLKFGDGSIFTVHEPLMEIGVNRVYDLGDGWLLRLPGYEYKGIDFPDGIPVIRDFQQMQPEIKRNGIPVVEIDFKRSVPNQAVVVKKIPHLFTLEDYLKGETSSGEKLKLRDGERKTIEKRVVQFARKTWMYSYIGDFRPDQIVYDGKEWILIDFMANNGVFTSELIEKLKEKKNTFSHFSTEPLARGKGMKPDKESIYRQFYDRRKIEVRLYKKINEAISDERKKQGKHPKLFRKIKKTGTYKREEDE